jgi:hypothetical protein
MKSRMFLCLAVGLCFSDFDTAEAGLLISPVAKWTTFAARPTGTEATPNYYGYAGELGLGYSVGQVFDLTAFGSYTPGRRKNAKLGEDDVSLITYGGGTALRFASAVYLGFKFGHSIYSPQNVSEENEIVRRYEGLGGGVAIGAISPTSKQSFVQTTFELMHHVLTSSDRSDDSTNEDGSSATKLTRRFDSVSIALAYVYNSNSSDRIQNKVFQGFLDSITFF